SERLAELARITQLPARPRVQNSTGVVSSQPSAEVKTPAKQPRIEFLEIRDNSGLAEKAVRARLQVALGEALDRKSLAQRISELYGSGLYQSIDYELVEKNGKTGLRINAKAKSWGPDYLQFGMQLEENFSADTSFNFGLAYIRTAINGLGGQWRTQLDLGDRQGVYTELYQPWSYDGRLFSRFRLGYERNILRVYNDNSDAIADIGIRELGSSISLGRQFGKTAELELAWRSLYGEVSNLVGIVDTETDTFDISEVSLTYRYDTLNRTNRPSSGSLLRLSVLSSPQSWRATSEYEQAYGLAMKAMHIPGGQASVSAILGSTVDSGSPLQSQFVLGGTGRLSGHAVNRFFGQHIAHMVANASWDITRLALPAYVGLSAEIGNTWDNSFGNGPDEWINAGSVYVGLNTVVGAVYVGAGFAEDGTRSFYLSLGNPYTAKPIRPFDEN
ncbi:MAG: BamA/TamA family outer membrane protein, partial [Pseudomonadales bacterium]